MSIFGDKWTDRFMAMASLVATWSKDPSTKVGAVVVDHSRSIVSLGFNGFPRHVVDDPERYENKSVKYAMVVHAEANAIVSARTSLVDKVLVATKFPCTECVKLIIQSGIHTVIAPAPDTTGKWADDSMISQQMLREACVTVEIWKHSDEFPLVSDDVLKSIVDNSHDGTKIALALEIVEHRRAHGELGPVWLAKHVNGGAK